MGNKASSGCHPLLIGAQDEFRNVTWQGEGVDCIGEREQSQGQQEGLCLILVLCLTSVGSVFQKWGTLSVALSSYRSSTRAAFSVKGQAALGVG